MGWTFQHEIAPIDRKSICRAMVSDRYEVVKDALVGSTWYAAIKNKETGEVRANIVLTAIDRNGYCNFGTKWMGEEVGPYHCDCPKGILDLLTPTDNEYAKEWRANCYKAIEEKKAKRESVLSSAPVGSRLIVTLKGEGAEKRTVIKMAPAYQFKSTWLLVEHQGRYIPKTRVAYAVYA